MNPTLSIIIPNFNGKDLLKKNMPSVIAAAKHCGWTFEVIVADDASTDDSILFLKENYPEIILVENKINGGFSKNINTGIKKAKHDWILALNSDISLDKIYFTPLEKYLGDENCFGVMGSIYDEPSGKLIDAAKYPTTKGLKIVGTTNYQMGNNHGQNIPTLFLSGANALMNRHKLLLLNGFDEIYSPFYQEDLDLGVKAWRFGWNCYFEKESKCFHQISSTIQSNFKKEKIKIIAKRNKLIFHQLHLNGWRLYCWKVLLGMNFAVRWIWVDSIFYKSFFEFVKRKNEITGQKKWLNNLLSEQPKSYSLQEIVRKIKSQIPEKVYKF